MTAPPKTRTRKRRIPARPTAHIGYQPAGTDLTGRRIRERYHALTNQAIKIGFRTRRPGQALCGSPGPWDDIPDGLFPPLVSCRSCQHIATTCHITITRSDT